MSAVQGHHLLPQATLRNFSELFERSLPGWNLDGKYNFSAMPTTQVAARQLNLLMHLGGHTPYNKAIEGLLDVVDMLPDPAEQTKRLAVLVNYLEDATNLENLADGSKTGGFVAFNNTTDPKFVEKFGLDPKGVELKAYYDKHLDWSEILKTDSAKEILDLDPRINANGKLEYNAKLPKPGGFFSITSAELADIDVNTSSSHKVFQEVELPGKNFREPLNKLRIMA